MLFLWNHKLPTYDFKYNHNVNGEAKWKIQMHIVPNFVQATEDTSVPFAFVISHANCYSSAFNIPLYF